MIHCAVYARKWHQWQKFSGGHSMSNEPQKMEKSTHHASQIFLKCIKQIELFVLIPTNNFFEIG